MTYAPTEFYTVAAFSDRSDAWEQMTDRMADRADTVQIVSDWRDTFARWFVVRVDLNTGTAQDVTDAIMAEAADDSDDCHSYGAQRTEAKLAGVYS